MKLFESVRYHLSCSLTPEQREFLKHLLINNGAEPAAGVKDATHVVTNSDKFEGWQEVGEGVHVVTEKWVERSLVLGKLQPPQYYSANPSDLFSGVIACSTDLPSHDTEVLSAAVLAMGGQWRTGLTKEVTHLFAVTTTSAKYTTALHHQAQTGIKIVLPHWFDDVVRLGAPGLDTKPYEWPEPQLLKSRDEEGGDGDAEAEKVKKAMAGVETDPMKRSVYSTVVRYAPVGDEEVKIPPPPPVVEARSQAKQVWGGRRVLLSRNLLLFGSRREAVEVGIRRAGGEVVRWEGDEEVDGKVRNEKRRQRLEADAVERCDIYVSRWREGRAYVRAFRLHKTIGTLAWLYHVQATGTITRPLDQLLHYPIPNRPIEGFKHHEITITNYTGEAREYLKKLIMIMGATFTPSMSAKNTVLIAAAKDGTKSTKALSWSIPVVNHTWLEDCFVEWRTLTFATERYISFPQGADYARLLGTRGVGLSKVVESEVEQIEEDCASDGEEIMDEEDERDMEMQMVVDGEPSAPPARRRGRAETEEVETEDGFVVPTGTLGSMREVEALVDGDVLMGGPAPEDDDDDDPPLPPPRSSISPAKKPHATPRKAATPKRTPNADSDTEEDGEEGAETTPRRRARSETKRYEPVAKRTRSQSRGPRTRSQSRPRAEVTKANTKANARGGKGKSVSRARSLSRARSQSRGRGRRKGESGDEEEEEEERRGRGTKARSKSKGRGRSYSRGRGRSRRDASEEEEEEEEEEEGPRRGRVKKNATTGSSRTRSQSRGRGRGRGNKGESETEEEEEEDLRPSKKSAKAKPAPKSKSKGKQASPSPSDSEDDEIEIIQDLRPTASTRRTTQAGDDVEDGDGDGGEVVVVVLKKGPPTGRSKTGAAKPKESRRKLVTPPPLDDDSDDDLPDLSSVLKEQASSSSKPKAKPGQSSTPRGNAGAKAKGGRGKAVIGTTFALEGRGKKGGPSKGKEKVVVEIDDDDDEEDANDAASAMDEDEPAATKKKAPAPAPAPRRRPGAAPPRPSAPTPVPVVEIPSQASTHSRRAAAVKANAQLHDVIMPDVVNFENQMRRSRKSGGGVAGFVVEGDTVKEERSSSAKRKKADAVKDEEDEEGEASGDEDGEEKEKDGQRGKRRKVVAKGSGKNEEVVEKRVIRLAATQVALPDDVTKSLSKLGVTMTSKPSDCTHLLAAGVVRTEKFLTAVANGAHILKKEWATESAKAGKILPESKYLLKDAGNKHGVDLQQSLERARRSKLFAGKTFYVAGKSVAGMVPLLKTVVTAGGGQLKDVQKLTPRIIAAGPERYAVSSQEDVSVWRQLAEAGTPVYSVELVIAGTLKQTFDPESARLDWAEDD